MAKAKKSHLHLAGPAQVPALISWLHGWQAAEKHYFKGKKPPGNMSDLIEKRVLGELQTMAATSPVKSSPGKAARKRRGTKTVS